MIARFEGREAAALLEQSAVAHDNDVAVAVAQRGRLKSYAKGEFLMRQNGIDNHVAFILAGQVAIEVNGKEVAVRHQHQHVGEMAIIDPTAKRSADVRALEDTLTFEVAEPEFTNLANQFPSLWRRLAVELSSRLRERTRLMRKPNAQPVVFIGSSSERLEIARSLQHAFLHDKFVVKTWADATFKAGSTPIESLIASLDTIDFSILVVTPDDLTTSREETRPTARDNVIFELGLAYGALGRDRTFMVRERGADVRLPSDLHGVRLIDIKPGSSELEIRIQPAAQELRSIISRVGVRVG